MSGQVSPGRSSTSEVSWLLHCNLSQTPTLCRWLTLLSVPGIIRRLISAVGTQRLRSAFPCRAVSASEAEQQRLAHACYWSLRPSDSSLDETRPGDTWLRELLKGSFHSYSWCIIYSMGLITRFLGSHPAALHQWGDISSGASCTQYTVQMIGCQSGVCRVLLMRRDGIKSTDLQIYSLSKLL